MPRPSFYIATKYRGQPAQWPDGAEAVSGIYEPSIWPTQDRTGPANESMIKRAVAFTKTRVVWFNIETWPMSIEFDSHPESLKTQQTIDKAKQVLRWAKEAAPDKKFGIYALPIIDYRQNFMYPWYCYHAAETTYNVFRIGRDRVIDGPKFTMIKGGLVAAADMLCPSLYIGGETMEEYLRWIEDTLDLFRIHDKPVCPFFKVTYVNEAQYRTFVAAIKMCHDRGHTPILWGGYDDQKLVWQFYDANAVWTRVLAPDGPRIGQG